MKPYTCVSSTDWVLNWKIWDEKLCILSSFLIFFPLQKETNEDDSVKNKRGKNNVLVNCLPDFMSGENKDSVVSNIKALAKMQQETLVHMKKQVSSRFENNKIR